MRNVPILVIVSLVCASAEAHHSYAQYDRCISVSIEGDIERVMWANPHTLITLKTDDAETYLVEWFDLQRLRRNSIERVLEAGDRIRVTGSENRDPKRNIVTLLTEVSRASDGWGWSRPFPVGVRCDGAPRE